MHQNLEAITSRCNNDTHRPHATEHRYSWGQSSYHLHMTHTMPLAAKHQLPWGQCIMFLACHTQSHLLQIISNYGASASRCLHDTHNTTCCRTPVTPGPEHHGACMPYSIPRATEHQEPWGQCITFLACHTKYHYCCRAPSTLGRRITLFARHMQTTSCNAQVDMRPAHHVICMA